MILNAKCHAIRDAQILEKKVINGEMQVEEKRLDQMMEIDRQNAIKMQEEIERKRREERFVVWNVVLLDSLIWNLPIGSTVPYIQTYFTFLLITIYMDIMPAPIAPSNSPWYDGIMSCLPFRREEPIHITTLLYCAAHITWTYNNTIKFSCHIVIAP